MVQIAIESVGQERFVRGFNRYVEDIKDFTEVYETLYQDFLGIEEKNFAGQGVPEGFTPLSPNYLKWKSKNYPGRPIMELTGALRSGLTQEGGQGSVKVIKGVDKYAEFGVRSPYAHRHQMGTAGMPQRKIVQLTDEDKKRWARTIQVWAYRKLKEGIAEEGGSGASA